MGSARRHADLPRLPKEGGTFVVDWATYNGYRRYHGECHVCHGPNGLGSTYAPALAEFAEDDGLRHLPRHRA